MGEWSTLQVEFVAMASPCSIMIDTQNEDAAQHAAHLAVTEVRRIEQKYSRYASDSVVSRINRDAAQTAVAVDEETAGLLDFAQRLWQLSDGCFDISSGGLRRAWNFRSEQIPTAEVLQTALASVGWAKLDWDGASIRFGSEGMEIDFGGIGKEYAADRAAHQLRQHGHENAMVNLGGDIHVLGPRARDDSLLDPWTIAIRHPRTVADSIAYLPLHRGGLATSGDYERFFEKDGRRYCHILDPRNGLPVTHWQSVSIVSANAVSAGALSTIAMLKEHDALAWLEGQGASYLAVRHDGAVFSKGAQPSTGVNRSPTA